MHALIVYDSVYGNTEWIAQAIAEGLKDRYSVRQVRVTEVDTGDLKGADLLVVGGPTHRHRASPAMKDFLELLPRRSLRGMAAVAFDTRYRMAPFFSGSAALEIVRQLRRAGASIADEPQSFFMEPDAATDGRRRHDRELLASGELERARTWASILVTPSDAKTPITV